MREPIWVEESKRLEQRVLFIAAICYCLAIILDNLVVKLPPTYFQVNIIVVGIGYIISSYKSSVVSQNILIGILWIIIGFINLAGLNVWLGGAPVAILSSSFGSFLVMCILVVALIKRRYEYRDHPSFVFCMIFAVFMALINVIEFFGIGASMNFFNMSSVLVYIGNEFLNLSSYSTIEFMTMSVVVLSLLFQAPHLMFFYEEEEAVNIQSAVRS